MRTNLLSPFMIVFIALLINNVSANTILPFSDDERNMIIKGFDLFKSRKFAGRNADGYYTNPNESTQVLDFWSNGKWAKYDRQGDGHHETMFQINGNQIDYVGIIGGDATFVTVGTAYNEFLNRPYWDWLRTLK